MTLPATQVKQRMVIQAFNEMTPDFCENNTPQFVDDKCGRVAFYSARRNLIFRPHPLLKSAIDNNQSFIARLIFNLKKIGVQFDNDKPFFFKIGYGHISLKIDAVISSGFPDFPQEKGIILAHVVSGKEFAEISESQTPYNGWMVNHAHILLAHGGFKKAAIFLINRASGETFAQVVELNFNIATQIENLANDAVANNVIPERINLVKDVTAAKEGASKCLSCPYISQCMLPDSPPPICNNCEHYQLSPGGVGRCMAQNGFELSTEMRQNMHQCGYHIYRPDAIDSWAEHLGICEKTQIGKNDLIGVKIGNHYANKLTGAEFFNVPSELDDNGQSYSSYEIYGAKGKDLIGDKGIDKLRKMFSAKIEGNDKDVSGSDFSD